MQQTQAGFKRLVCKTGHALATATGAQLKVLNVAGNKAGCGQEPQTGMGSEGEQQETKVSRRVVWCGVVWSHNVMVYDICGLFAACHVHAREAWLGRSV